MSKRGVVKGRNLPSRYAGGNPCINLALRILLDAQRDAEMWNDYVQEFGEPTARPNVSPEQLLEQSHWVIEWLNEHREQADAMGINKEDLEELIKFREGNVISASPGRPL